MPETARSAGSRVHRRRPGRLRKNLVRQTTDCDEFRAADPTRQQPPPNYLAHRGTQGVIDMADDRDPYRSHGRRTAEEARRQHQERMKAYHGWVHGAAATPLLMSR